MSTSFSPYIVRTDRDHLSFFYDDRSRNLDPIRAILESKLVQKLQESIERKAYIVLGGDGTFIDIAKLAHRDDVSILGINFGTKGFLLHEQKALEADVLKFTERNYPILHVDIDIEGEKDHIHGHAFNEVYITRSGHTSSLELTFSHRGREIPSYRGDGLMISTPVGSTGWSRSYGGVILSHTANMNIITPVGGAFPRELASHPIDDRGRIRIRNTTTRNKPLDVLVDNIPVISSETRRVNVVVERASRSVRLLIENSYIPTWDNKPYTELGYSPL